MLMYLYVGEGHHAAGLWLGVGLHADVPVCWRGDIMP
jgi:hypothetical protein